MVSPNGLNIVLIITEFKNFELEAFFTALGFFEKISMPINEIFLLSNNTRSSLDDIIHFDKADSFDLANAAINSAFLGSKTDLVSNISDILSLSSKANSSVCVLSDCFDYSSNFLKDIIEISELDEKFGFITPRTNLISICSYTTTILRPENLFSRPSFTLRIEDMAEYQLNSLNRYSIIPIAPIINTYISASMLQLTSTFIAQFQVDKSWYNFVTACNNLGYLTLVANFSEAFNSSSVNSLPDNVTLLNSLSEDINPSLRSSLKTYSMLPTNRYTNLIAASKPSGQPSILLDLSNLTNVPNGTSKLDIELLKTLVETNKIVDQFKLNVLISTMAYEAFNLKSLLEGLNIFFDVNEIDQYFTIRILLSQPFSYDTTYLNYCLAPINVYYFLDSIAFDCNYLLNDTPELHFYWKFIAEYAHSLCFLSQNGMYEFNGRFNRKFGENDFFCWGSIDPTDYLIYKSPNELNKQQCRPEKTTLFVVGNHFEHKRVTYFTDLIYSNFADANIVSLGYNGSKDVIALNSGIEPREMIDAYYEQADIVIFPSVFEGFGFPIIEALAAGKPVIFVRSKLTDEILASLKLSRYSNLLFEAESDESLLNSIEKLQIQEKSDFPLDLRVSVDTDTTHLFNWTDASHLFLDQMNYLLQNLSNLKYLESSLLVIETAKPNPPIQPIHDTFPQDNKRPQNARDLLRINERYLAEFIQTKFPAIAGKLIALKQLLRKLKSKLR